MTLRIADRNRTEAAEGATSSATCANARVLFLGMVLSLSCSSPPEQSDTLASQTGPPEEAPAATSIVAQPGNPGEFVADSLTLLVDGSAVTPELVAYVAKIGTPKRVVVQKGQTVREAAAMHCPGKHYLQQLANLPIGGLPESLAMDSRLEHDRAIELPACLPVRGPQYTFEARLVQKGDSPWAYYENDRAGLDWRLQAQRDTAMQATTNYLAAFSQRNENFVRTGIIRTGDEVFVPRTTPVWSSVELRREFRTDGGISGEVTSTLSRLLVEGGQDPEDIVFENPEEITLYTEIADSDSQGACQQPEGDSGRQSAFDPAELAQVLSYNISRNSNTDSATIVIADTGLYAGGRLPFAEHRVRRDDPAGLLATFDPPYPKYEHHNHGTYVATAALGGPIFMQMIEGLGLKIELAPINILKETVGTGEPPPLRHRVQQEAFNRAIQVAHDLRGVLNLSVGRQAAFTGLERELGKDSQVLFVVAAGNDRRPLSARTVYPARYGGPHNDGQYNLITVAALDLSGGRAAFSNYGQDYVDLAAPGCLQPVLRFDPKSSAYELQEASGTSFAAPLVSFTAALLKSFWRDARPRDIKRRILAACDISPQLQLEEVFDHRRLNVVKALALYQDAVEANISGETRLIRGRIDSDRQFFTFCDGVPTLHRTPGHNRNVIRKVAKFGDDRNLLIYWTTADGTFERAVCPNEGISLSLTVRDEFTNQSFALENGEIIDVVFSELGS